MDRRDFASLNIDQVETPCYITSEQALERNLRVIAGVREAVGCKILLALKGFAQFSTFPIVSKYLQGVCCSSLHEAMLGYEEFVGEVHIYAPAYSDQDMLEIIKIADHIVFNSLSQWQHHKEVVQGADRDIQCGLRINPEYSEVEVPLYNPCVPGSRFGILKQDLKTADLEGISGFHFHTMCEQNSDVLARTIDVIHKNFSPWFEQLDWINFGGGHHISRDGYDVDLLCDTLSAFKKKHGLEIYLEPGEAIALNAGILVASVLDIIHNDMDIAILDVSATAHMPDVLEMPYRAQIVGGDEPGKLDHTYRLGGLTCLAGDVVGDYSFAEPLQAGHKLVFLDMAHYTMVKNTTFNGVRLPSIALFHDASGELEVVREFGYEDYKTRLS